jgi:hypothetical protein
MKYDIGLIRMFLLKREWIIGAERDNFTDYYPSKSFKFSGAYKVSLPKNENAFDIDKYLYNIISILSELYNIPKDDLSYIFLNNVTIMSFGIIDENTKEGLISFNRFRLFADKLKQLLLDTASFVINKNNINYRTPEEANDYLKLCKFMPSQKGSYIAKIQLPAVNKLIEKNIIEQSDIIADDVNIRLFDILDFVNNNIFINDRMQNIEQLLSVNKEILNYNVLKDIEEMYEQTSLSNVNISFLAVNYSKKIYNHDINDIKKTNLSTIVKEIQMQLEDSIDVVVRGKIIQLHSEDPSGDKNVIHVHGVFDFNLVTVIVKLDNDKYIKAIEAHKSGNSVTISGLAKRSRQQLRMVDLLRFVIH